MARVLFFIQLIFALVILPWWPGLDPRFTFLGLVFLALVLTLPFAAVVGVYGFQAAARALADAWSTRPLGPQSRSTRKVWNLAVRSFPLAGVLGGLTALIGALGELDPGRSPVSQALVVGFFCLVWGLLGLLLGRILEEVVVRLSKAPLLPLLLLSPAFGRRFGLTPREVEAAQAVLDGLTYRATGARLFISTATVKSHVLSVYQKTGTGNKIELLRLVEAENGRIHQTVDGAGAGSGRS